MHLNFDYTPGYVHPDAVDIEFKEALKVLAIDAKTGKVAWERTAYDGVMFDDRHRKNTYASSTMVTDGERAYASFEWAGPYVYDFKGNLAWKKDLGGLLMWHYNKGVAYVPSPIALGDYLYLLSDAGIMTCIDAVTGERRYEGGRVPVPATFFASPVAFENKILLTSEDPDSFVIEAGPVHKVLHTNTVGEPVYASPAIANGTIYIRGDKHLFAIRKR